MINYFNVDLVLISSNCRDDQLVIIDCLLDKLQISAKKIFNQTSLFQKYKSNNNCFNFHLSRLISKRFTNTYFFKIYTITKEPKTVVTNSITKRHNNSNVLCSHYHCIIDRNPPNFRVPSPKRKTKDSK